MDNILTTKLNKLSPGLKNKLSQEDFLARLDEIEEQYGVKAVLILLSLLLGEIDYSTLSEKLKVDYDLNDFLADEIKMKFGGLIKTLGESSKQIASAVTEPAKTIVESVKEKPVNSSLAALKIEPEPVSKIPQSLARPTVSASPITFSTEDEEEVKKYLKVTSAVSMSDYAAQARKFMASYGFKSTDDDLAKRLENLIVSHLKGLRDDLEIKENLIKSKNSGGMEFSESDAEKLINLINNKPMIVASQKNSASVNIKNALQSVDELLPIKQPASSVAKQPQPTIAMEDGLPVINMPEKNDLNNAPVENKLRVKPDDVKMKNDTPSGAAVIDVKKTETKIEAMPAPRPAPFIAKKDIPETVLNAKTSGRANLDDVKLERKTEGPIDELANLTIIDFRRLAADPKAAVNKIKERIDLLDRESFVKKTEGISAWQTSEVSRFYRLLGQASMTENMNIEAVIRERLMANKPTLTLDEFEAIMELNRQLRY